MVIIKEVMDTIEVMDAIQLVTNILSSLGVLIALIVLIVEIIKNTESNQFDSFIKLLENYNSFELERKTLMHKIKEVVRKNPKTKDEWHDKQDSISYLLIRLNQPEPFLACELELLDLEIKCLSYLNELCKMAFSNIRAKSMLLLKESDNITYYQTRLGDLINLYKSENKIRHLHKPRFSNLEKISVEEYFDQTKFQ